jgi:manganese/zinc/iron transport system permease protein
MTIVSILWTSLDTWIVIAAILAGICCSLLGSFLVLKKMSMMGDAISHAVLPGIAIAFLLSGSRSGIPLLIGAGLVGILTTVLVQLIHHHTKLEEGATMGVVFTVLFAIGLILIEQTARNVDIHPEHVLFGAVELVPLRMTQVFGFDIPQGVLVLAGVLIFNLIFVVSLFKELRLASFDPALATSLGINSTFLHYVLMVMVSVTIVAAFEVVGSILVIAMLIVPGAIAWLLTSRLSTLLLVSSFVSIVAAILGHLVAIGIPPLFGFVDTSTAGSMALVLGVLFFLTMIVAPDQGLLARGLKRFRLGFEIHSQDVLGLMARSTERGGNQDSEITGDLISKMTDESTHGVLQEQPVVQSRTQPGNLTYQELQAIDGSPFINRPLRLSWVLGVMRLDGLIKKTARGYHTTERGHKKGQEILRSHRLWETYIHSDNQKELPELHGQADVLEHFTDESLREALREQVSDAKIDPQGREIPD